MIPFQAMNRCRNVIRDTVSGSWCLTAPGIEVEKDQ